MTETVPNHNRGVAHPVRNPQATTSLAEPIGPQTGEVRSTLIQVNNVLYHKLDPSLVSALQQCPRDRTFLLRIEKQLTAYIHQPVEKIRLDTPFPPYQRMLVHRLADYFGLARIVEKKGHTATITLVKTAGSIVPERSLQMVCEELNVLTPEERAPKEFKPMIQQRAHPSEPSEPSDARVATSAPSSPHENEQFVEPRRDVEGIDDCLISALSNLKERKFLLKLEKEVIRRIQMPDCKNIKLTTPFMAYHRMLVHRLADCYGLARIVEKKGSDSLITLVKVDISAIPKRTLQMALDELNEDEQGNQVEEEDEDDPVVSEEKVVFTSAPKIMQRSRTPENEKSDCPQTIEQPTLEDREKQYAEARKRIFGTDEPEFEDAAEAPVPTVAPKNFAMNLGKGKNSTPPKGGNGKGMSAVPVKDPKIKALDTKWQDQYDPAYNRSHPQYPAKGQAVIGAAVPSVVGAVLPPMQRPLAPQTQFVNLPPVYGSTAMQQQSIRQPSPLSQQSNQLQQGALQQYGPSTANLRPQQFVSTTPARDVVHYVAFNTNPGATDSRGKGGMPPQQSMQQQGMQMGAMQQSNMQQGAMQQGAMQQDVMQQGMQQDAMQQGMPQDAMQGMQQGIQQGMMGGMHDQAYMPVVQHSTMMNGPMAVGGRMMVAPYQMGNQAISYLPTDNTQYQQVDSQGMEYSSNDNMMASMMGYHNYY
eukprot:GEMP01002151.1.p1 GENE.GEMP01002151.1~~GEMP01002151.1.p1  ORF type:complete len:700 (+),score=148.43 GEMP01002151.1:32-2131(+)